MLNTKMMSQELVKRLKQLMNTELPKPKKKRKPLAEAEGLAKELPDFMQGHKELLGVHIGGCIVSGEWDDKTMGAAHAHCNGYGKGYICCKSMKQFEKDTTMKHELAHILTGKGHVLGWAKCYVDLLNGDHKWLTVPWLKNKYGFKTRKKKTD